MVKRYHLEMPDPVASEIESIREKTGLTKSEVFRHAISLLSIYVSARSQGGKFMLENDQEIVQIEMPILLRAAHEKGE